MESVVGIVARTVDAAHQLAKTIHGANCKWSYQQWIGLRPGESNAVSDIVSSCSSSALSRQSLLIVTQYCQRAGSVSRTSPISGPPIARVQPRDTGLDWR